MVVWLNGALADEARIDPADRGFTLGDGMFETIRVAGGRPRHLARHFARLHEGVGVVGFALPHDEASLAQAIDGLLAACGLPHLPPGDLRPSRGLTSRSAQRLALTTFWDQ